MISSLVHTAATVPTLGHARRLQTKRPRPQSNSTRPAPRERGACSVRGSGFRLSRPSAVTAQAIRAHGPAQPVTDSRSSR